MEEEKSMHGFKGASISKELTICGKKLSDKIEEEVLEKYKVEVSKTGACKGRGSVAPPRIGGHTAAMVELAV